MQRLVTASSSPHVTWRECQSQLGGRHHSTGKVQINSIQRVFGCRRWRFMSIAGLETLRNRLKNEVFPAPLSCSRLLVHVLKVATRQKWVKRNRCFGTNFLPRLSRTRQSFRCNEGQGDRDSAPRHRAVCKLYPKHCLNDDDDHNNYDMEAVEPRIKPFRWIGHVTTM